jgi:hypothetical protein
MIAISGRWRFGGFKAARVAASSCFAIEGAAVRVVAKGRERIHAMAPAAPSATALKPLQRMVRRFMAPRLLVSRYTP